MVPNSLDHFLTITNGQRERLFAIDVLAGLSCHDGHDRVPMIGHHNRYGIDVVSSKDLAEVVVSIAPSIRASPRFLRIISVHPILPRLATQELFGAHGSHG